MSVIVSIKGLEEVIALVRSLQSRFDNFTDPMKQASVYMQGSILKNFEAQGRPVPWAALAPMTIGLRRKGDGGGSPKILQDTGRLKASIMPYIIGDTEFGAGTNVEYAHLMNYGGMSESKDIQISRSGATPYTMHTGEHQVPARPFAVLQDEDVPFIVGIFRKWIAKAFDGGANG